MFGLYYYYEYRTYFSQYFTLSVFVSGSTRESLLSHNTHRGPRGLGSVVHSDKKV